MVRIALWVGVVLAATVVRAANSTLEATPSIESLGGALVCLGQMVSQASSVSQRPTVLSELAEYAKSSNVKEGNWVWRVLKMPAWFGDDATSVYQKLEQSIKKGDVSQDMNASLIACASHCQHSKDRPSTIMRAVALASQLMSILAADVDGGSFSKDHLSLMIIPGAAAVLKAKQLWHHLLNSVREMILHSLDVGLDLARVISVVNGMNDCSVHELQANLLQAALGALHGTAHHPLQPAIQKAGPFWAMRRDLGAQVLRKLTTPDARQAMQSEGSSSQRAISAWTQAMLANMEPEVWSNVVLGSHNDHVALQCIVRPDGFWERVPAISEYDAQRQEWTFQCTEGAAVKVIRPLGIHGQPDRSLSSLFLVLYEHAEGTWDRYKYPWLRNRLPALERKLDGVEDEWEHDELAVDFVHFAALVEGYAIYRVVTSATHEQNIRGSFASAFPDIPAFYSLST